MNFFVFFFQSCRTSAVFSRIDDGCCYYYYKSFIRGLVFVLFLPLFLSICFVCASLLLLFERGVVWDKKKTTAKSSNQNKKQKHSHAHLNCNSNVHQTLYSYCYYDVCICFYASPFSSCTAEDVVVAFNIRIYTISFSLLLLLFLCVLFLHFDFSHITRL